MLCFTICIVKCQSLITRLHKKYRYNFNLHVLVSVQIQLIQAIYISTSDNIINLPKHRHAERWAFHDSGHYGGRCDFLPPQFHNPTAPHIWVSSGKDQMVFGNNNIKAMSVENYRRLLLYAQHKISIFPFAMETGIMADDYSNTSIPMEIDQLPCHDWVTRETCRVARRVLLFDLVFCLLSSMW